MFSRKEVNVVLENVVLKCAVANTLGVGWEHLVPTQFCSNDKDEDEDHRRFGMETA